MSASDVIIVGGGLIGLSLAWRLAQRGVSVTVLEAGRAGQASAAAAGMLAPLAETETHGPLVDLGIESLRRYPDFLAELSEATETDRMPSGPGMLRIALTEDEEESLCRAFAWQKQLGLTLERLDADAVRHLEPWLAPTVRAAILSPTEQHVAPRPFHAMLLSACLSQVVNIRSESAAGFEVKKERVTGVRTQNGIISGGRVVIAAGAWSSELAKALQFACPLVPVKGQILALGPQLPLPIRHTLYAHSGYIVPRGDGRIVVGATEERVGFDTATTATGVHSLLQRALTLAPSLGAAPVDEIWTGLRPVSPDGSPLLGSLPGWKNVSLATGHGRNGVLLTPITADLMADHLLNDTPLPAAFAPARFGPDV